MNNSANNSAIARRLPGEVCDTSGRRVVLASPRGEFVTGSPRASMRVTNGAGGVVIATREATGDVTVVFDTMPRVIVILPEGWVKSDA